MKRFIITLVVLMLISGAALAGTVDPAPVFPNIDLTPILQAIIALLASIITIKLIPWIQSKTTAQQQAMLRAAVSVAVYAAEQIYGTGGGHDKLMYVKAQLRKKGFDIDIDEIEAAVKELAITQDQGKIIIPDTEAPSPGDEDEAIGLTE